MATGDGSGGRVFGNTVHKYTPEDIQAVMEHHGITDEKELGAEHYHDLEGNPAVPGVYPHEIITSTLDSNNKGSVLHAKHRGDGQYDTQQWDVDEWNTSGPYAAEVSS